MNAKELVRATLEGRPTPRIPAGPLAVHYCARIAGCSLRRYSTDPGALAEAVLRYYERFRPDAVWFSSDTWVSAQAMGARVDATDDNQPFGGFGGPVIQTAADIDRIPDPDVGLHGRYPMMLEAFNRIAAGLGREVFLVACFDQYPFSLAAALMGIERILVKAVEDPPFVEALMHRCEAWTLAYATALGRAGADLLSGGDSPAGLLGPRLYRRCAWPAEQRLIRRLKTVVDVPVSLHVCGDTTRLLPDLAGTGADVLEIDAPVSLAAACDAVGPGIALWGNLDPVRVLTHGTPEAVREAAQELIRTAKARGHRRFVLSSGCTLTLDTPPENLEALIETARRSSTVSP